jgi:hypothetical protein
MRSGEREKAQKDRRTNIENKRRRKISEKIVKLSIGLIKHKAMNIYM